MKIPEDKIAEIREATDIFDVVSQYVTLKKRGKAFMGLCPFHNEKSPSFSVDPVRGFYHCFGCGEGGNVFSFVMAMEKVSFPEAVRTLAEKAGIPVVFSQADEESAKETELLYHVNQKAAEFFRECLLKTDAGKRALGYLTERGFKPEIVERFGLGYAPNRWDGLIRMAGRASMDPAQLVKAGLIVERKDRSGHYDRFRGRLMFPIHNPSGRIVGFGGRAMTEEKDVPKYINTPETPVYRKSRILYGLYQSAAGIRNADRALLVEGYTDVMRLHQEGFDYAVASAGTALTAEQASLLTRYSKRVALVYDGDSAGFQAALRGVDVLIGAGHHVEVSPLPAGSDPDSFLKSQGVEGMQAVLDQAQGFVDFRLAMLRNAGKLDTASDRANAARLLLETLSRVKDPVERQLAFKELAEKLGVEESLLRGQMKRAQDGADADAGDREPQKAEAKIDPAEAGILRLLLEDADRWGAKIFRFVRPELFRHPDVRLVVGSVHEAFLSGKPLDAGTLLGRHADSPRIEQMITGLLSLMLDEGVDRDQFAFDCVVKLKEAELDEAVQSVRERIRSAHADGKDVNALGEEFNELNEKRSRLRGELDEAWKK